MHPGPSAHPPTSRAPAAAADWNPTAAPPPLLDLTAALVALSAAAGYDIDTDELPVTTGLRSDLVARWVHTGAQILINRYQRLLLLDPIEVMRSALDNDGAPAHAEELAGILADVDELDRTLPLLSQRFSTVCHHIGQTGLGMAWPAAADTTPTQAATTLLTAALLAAGFRHIATHTLRADRPDGGAITIRIDTAVSIIARPPPTEPGWAATFALTTPPAVIIAAAAA
jgi:hypothetical protein